MWHGDPLLGVDWVWDAFPCDAKKLEFFDPEFAVVGFRPFEDSSHPVHNAV